MRTYEEASAAALDQPAFSNGSEGMAWTGAWCEQCVHDIDGQNMTGPGCPLVMVSLMGKTPSEWLEQPWQQIKGRPEGEVAPSLDDRYHCVEFRDVSDPGPGYGPVIEPLPGQLELFPADAYEKPRMFVDVVAEIAQVDA